MKPPRCALGVHLRLARACSARERSGCRPALLHREYPRGNTSRVAVQYGPAGAAKLFACLMCNVQELDVPGEWFYDADLCLLYVFPNGTNLSVADVVVPVVDAVIVVNGSQSGPGAYAKNVSFSGFTITQSRVTFLEQYEVPSGGDWSIHRGAALFVQVRFGTG